MTGRSRPGPVVLRGVTVVDTRDGSLTPDVFLGRTSTLGTVEPGQQADLVLLDANPVESVQHLHGLAGVVRAGRYHPAAAPDRSGS